MARQAHYWTANKLDFLESYIPAFVKATQQARARYYVDGFSGPGTNDISGVKRNGSPLIAVNVTEPCTRYFFVERRKALFKELTQHVAGHPRESSVELMQGDFNELADDILSRIPSFAPCLFFLDPEGLELRFDTVVRISKRAKADLFILISGFGVIRNVMKPEVAATLTQFFGDDSWKPLYERYQGGELPVGTKAFEAFTDLYIEKLVGLGFRVSKEYLVARNSKNAALHSLVFAIKSDKPQAALRIAPDILRKLQSGMQGRLAFE